MNWQPVLLLIEPNLLIYLACLLVVEHKNHDSFKREKGLFSGVDDLQDQEGGPLAIIGHRRLVRTLPGGQIAQVRTL